MIADEEKVLIRPATLDDAAGVNGVYNPFIRTSPATFEMQEHTSEERRQWLAAQARSPRTPVFVADDPRGDICGFASASPFDPRGAYETSVKTSVFIAPAAAGRGLGARLYERLFAALGGQDVHRAYALVVTPNPASVALHRKFGFRELATLSEVGRKFGRYHDVTWFEKRL